MPWEANAAFVVCKFCPVRMLSHTCTFVEPVHARNSCLQLIYTYKIMQTHFALRACVRACACVRVRACVRGWVGGWAGGWVGGCVGACVRGWVREWVGMSDACNCSLPVGLNRPHNEERHSFLRLRQFSWNLAGAQPKAPTKMVILHD